MKTTTGLPFAVTCQLGTGHRATLAHLFDTAGENYRDAQMHDALGFLDEGHGFVYVLDPFSIPWVRNRLAGNNAEAVQARPRRGRRPRDRLRRGRVPDAGQWRARRRAATGRRDLQDRPAARGRPGHPGWSAAIAGGCQRSGCTTS